MKRLTTFVVVLLALSCCRAADAQYSEAKLAQWLNRFPKADANRDGKLTVAEAEAYRKQMQSSRRNRGGAPRAFRVDAGWQKDRFPEHAVCYKSPEEIAELYRQFASGREAVIRYEKPTDGSLRSRVVLVGGHFEFAFDRSEAGFHEGVVVAVGCAAHALTDAGAAQHRAVTSAGVLSAAIAVMNQAVVERGGRGLKAALTNSSA